MSAIRSPLSSGLVGRDGELARLHAALDEARAGRGGVVLLAGEAGIGKTTLAERLATDAAEEGVSVVWGRCPEGQVAPPFTPWLQVLRTWSDRSTDPEVSAALEPATSSLAHLLPELSGRSGVAPDAELEGPWGRFRLIEAVGETVARVGRVGPVVVVLDDLHAADASSLAVTESVGRAIIDAAVLLVGAYRDTELVPDAAESIGRVLRLPRAQQLSLAGLDADAVRSCLEGVTGHAVAEERAVAVWRRTGGNPFFVGEVARGSDGDRLPESVRAVLRHRLAALDPELLQLLETAAVIGREFNDAWLAEVVAISVAEVLDRLDPAVSAGLVELTGVGQHRFVHELVRETLLAGLPAAVLADLHGRVGEAIERQAGLAADEHLDELALHYAEAAAHGGDAVRAVDSLERAAGRARRLLAYDEAAAHLDRACALATTHPQIEPERRCDLLLASGDAWTTVGRFDRAQAAYAEAMDAARPLGDHHRMAAAALGHFGPARLERRVVCIPLLDEALSVVPPEEEALRARLLACRAAIPAEQPGGREQAEDAWRFATETDDPEAIVLAARGLGFLSLTPAHLDEAVKVADRGLDAARRLGALELVSSCLTLRSLVALFRGELADVERLEEQRQVAAEAAGRPTDVLWGHVHQGRRALLHGDFDAAEAAILAQQVLTDRGEGIKAELDLWVGQLLWLRWSQGRAEEVQDLIARQPAPSGRPGAGMRLFQAFAALQAGDPAPARAALERDLPMQAEANDNWFRPAALAMLAELALDLDDHGAITTLHQVLGPWAGLHATWTVGFYLGPFDLYLGRLGAALGDEQAVPSLEDALRFVEAVDARPLVMATKEALAGALDRRGDPGDDERARELLDEAATLARDLGLGERARKGEALLVRGAVRDPAGLSAREADVLGMLATGSSNQQIAGTLHLSVKTVERHLSNLYRKLGVSNRTEAAAYALRRLRD